NFFNFFTRPQLGQRLQQTQLQSDFSQFTDQLLVYSKTRGLGALDLITEEFTPLDPAITSLKSNRIVMSESPNQDFLLLTALADDQTEFVLLHKSQREFLPLLQ